MEMAKWQNLYYPEWYFVLLRMSLEKIIKVVIKHNFLISNFFNILHLSDILFGEPNNKTNINNQVYNSDDKW